MPKPRRQTATSNTYRFFISAEAVRGDAVLVEDAALAHQLATVLRLGVGDTVVLLDNLGWQYTVTLTQLTRSQVGGIIQDKQLAAGEPRSQITLFLALMRHEKFEWVLQKGTELGICAFVPLITERSMADASDMTERKTDRWNKIIREAAEQSRRGKLPQLGAALPFAQGCAQAAQHGTALLLWEGAGAQPLRQALARAKQHGGASTAYSVAFLTGPEGGFADHELETARSHGIIPVTLGPRTLRAETAPLAATAAMLYEMGDLE
ncbi:MAG: 16S rRNA (uracil(1498)-N(3))-methyltransferase [Roseiflexaceae bacterium]|nr:16S rRNA (uracil(1498)-N(3))-methyltransferase [Roseiflexaceae bacterium]